MSNSEMIENLRRRVEERAICDDSLPVVVPLGELRALAAERDAQAARADAAEAEVVRLTDEIAKQMLADEMLRGLYDDEAADVARLNAELRSLRAGQAARVLLITSDRGVCVGGRWDGWLMIRHPDGHWVSHHKLDAVDPRTEMMDQLRAIGGDA